MKWLIVFCFIHTLSHQDPFRPEGYIKKLYRDECFSMMLVRKLIRKQIALMTGNFSRA